MSYTVGESYAGLSGSDYEEILAAAEGNETLIDFLNTLEPVDGFYVYLGDDMALIEALEEVGYEDRVNYYTFLGSNWEMGGF